jgi:hypothetical protein
MACFLLYIVYSVSNWFPVAWLPHFIDFSTLIVQSSVGSSDSLFCFCQFLCSLFHRSVVLNKSMFHWFSFDENDIYILFLSICCTKVYFLMWFLSSWPMVLPFFTELCLTSFWPNCQEVKFIFISVADVICLKFICEVINSVSSSHNLPLTFYM